MTTANGRRNGWLILGGIAGIIVFILLLDQFYPYKAANLKIGRDRAVEIAQQFLDRRGYQVQAFRVMAAMSYDIEAFTYLQNEFGFQKAQQIFRAGEKDGLALHWDIFWYKNVPRSAPQERFNVTVSSTGQIVGFFHDIPDNFKWPDSADARLSQENAYQVALNFLEAQDVDVSGYQKEPASTKVFQDRTDHSFRWSRQIPDENAHVDLIVRVQGDEIGAFSINYQLPQQAAGVIKAQRGGDFFANILSFTFTFFIGLFLLSVFLRKYHEGEVGIKTAGIMFFALWGTLALEALLKMRLYAYGSSFGELSYDGVAMVIFIVLAFIIWPFFSLMGFAAWSVGEALGRETYSHKFTALDGLFNRHFSTTSFAQSASEGYLAGFTILGGLAGLTWIAVHVFGATTDIDGYQMVVPAYLSFLLPVLIALSTGLLSELVFRLFGNLYLLKYLRKKWLAAIVVSMFWTGFAVSFWGVNVSLTPLVYSLGIWFLMGLFLTFVFWKYDVLTVIMANVVVVGIMQSLPLLTAGSSPLQLRGVGALVVLFFPVIYIIRGWMRKEKFEYQPELVPPHIKRITDRVRMTRELEIARQVQMRLLPKTSPDFDGFDISGLCLPAKEVGGDYYDFIRISNDRLGIVIGDVSGKGVPAAIYMTLTKGIVQSNAEENVSPREVLIKVNNLLYRTIDRSSFVSLFYAVIDRRKKTLVYSRAGHNPVFYLRMRDHRVNSLQPNGIALGLEKGQLFSRVIDQVEMSLETGDLLVFYTDGFTEAMNKNLEEYGEQRLLEVIEKHKQRPSADILQAIVHELRVHIGDFPQHDDMTVVLVRVL